MAAKSSKLALAPQPEAPAEARAVLRRFASSADPDQLQIAELLLTELVTNSMRHGHLKEKEKITIELHQDDDTLKVCVRNPNGSGGLGAEELGEPRSRGYGLALVDKLAERWGQAGNDFTEVWFELSCA
jgi:anti-sigma regulatory factor (Ser/Thr protein kinase)